LLHILLLGPILRWVRSVLISLLERETRVKRFKSELFRELLFLLPWVTPGYLLFGKRVKWKLRWKTFWGNNFPSFNLLLSKRTHFSISW
jgi:hypothetical protein